jgi:hypothetical protein
MATQDGFQPYPIGLTASEVKEAIEKAHNLDADEIRLLVEAATDSNVFTDDEKTKLNDIELNATSDQTDAEIRTAIENATDSNVFTDDDHTKLNDIELNATSDQTDAEIRTAIENATDSNVFTDDDHTKLNDIELNATSDQTDAEIRTAIENALDSNVFTDDEKTKLNDIETGATSDQTDAEIRTAIETALDSNVFTDDEKTKLNDIELNATSDQTDAEIRTAIEAATDSNVFTDDDHTKLGTIEEYAKNDQTSTEIRALMEASPSFTGTADFVNIGASGSVDVAGRVTIQSSQDVDESSVSGGLIIGSTGTGSHIAIDNNEIMAKSNSSTAGELNLNLEGGLVKIGSGGLLVSGDINLELNGTIDGRTLSEDGDKLDNIEDNATADQSATEIQAVVFPSGTRMLFQQSTAPVGWTKETAYSDRVLRVVSGGVGYGGSVPFSVLFNRTGTDDHVLTVAQMPAHNHGSVGDHSHSYTSGDGGSGAGFQDYSGSSSASTGSAGGHQHSSVGSNAPHAHTMDMRLQYVDLIIAGKD